MTSRISSFPFIPAFSSFFWRGTLAGLAPAGMIPSSFFSILSTKDTSRMLLGSRRSASGISQEKRSSRATTWNRTDMSRKRFIKNTGARHKAQGEHPFRCPGEGEIPAAKTRREMQGQEALSRLPQSTPSNLQKPL
jgi:hypothetical protein